LAATFYACGRKLKQMPATLMRPKAPKAGARVLLERATFIWKKLSFLNKVTARNLFRYKKRMVMTIVGICGCTALLLCGFTIKNTVSEMIPQQYKVIYKYDLMAVTADDDFEVLDEKMTEDQEIEQYLPARVEAVEIYNEAGQKETLQVIVVADGKELEPYILLKDKENHELILGDGDIFLTRNATRILGLEKGDVVTWQNQDLVEVEAPITQIVENYLGNMAYMTEATYLDLFETYEPNAVLATFTEQCEDFAAYTDELARMDEVLSAVSTEEMAGEFNSAFALINMVVYVILVLAALLAFVVLFTLSNTNISERERELATIKVLGFYNHEVHSYVNKETLILTGIGLLCGMPAGLLLGRYVMGILEFPSLEFYIILYPESYAMAGAITIIFALMVNFITNKTLNKIDMIEALKSVE
ncbi:MAG: ABC transporter permease, partial [Dorea sp.]